MARRTVGGRRGNALLVITTLGGAVGFGTLSVDLGMVWLAKIELQQAVDDAAISAVSELDGTEEGLARARATARAVAAAHTVLGEPVDLTWSPTGGRVAAGSTGVTGVTLGRYDEFGTFVPYVAGADLDAVNAVQVERFGQPVPAGLGGFLMGTDHYEVDAHSRTRRRLGALKARSTECFLPIAVPDCHLAPLAPGYNPAPFTFTFSPSPTDAIAWADPDRNPNADDTRDQLIGMCDHGNVAIGDLVYVNEGSKTTALHTIRDVLDGGGSVAPTLWDEDLYGEMPERGCIGAPTSGGDGGGACSPSNSDVSGAAYGNVLEGPVFLVDAGDDCSDVSFTHTKRVTGIAWGVIYDVKTSGSGKHVSMLLDVKNPHLVWGDAAEPDADDPTNVLVPSAPEMLGW